MNQLSIRKNNLQTKKKKKGFTLVELIIVIAVIAVLAAIAIPKFGAVKQDANKRADQANAKIIATAVASAVADGAITGTSTETEVTSATYLKYIDGNTVPTVKEDTTKSFYATYSTTNGTKVYLGNGGSVLYPAS
jgi:type IV pilus assembly protein PilA